MKKMVNGVLMDMTAKDIAQYNEDQKNLPTEFDIVIGYLRDKRNSLLAKTDWTSSSDLTMSNAMKTYRQQLRDATKGLDTVEKVQAYEFPTEVTK
jgi:hypothetical protein|tara:strand:- start:201 stop:485 length:285 start_codon:yes stop_codon:yes gene_type:complete